jgi:hypothetical protein
VASVFRSIQLAAEKQQIAVPRRPHAS